MLRGQREQKTHWKLQGIDRPGVESLREASYGEKEDGATGREDEILLIKLFLQIRIF